MYSGTLLLDGGVIVLIDNAIMNGAWLVNGSFVSLELDYVVALIGLIGVGS